MFHIYTNCYFKSICKRSKSGVRWGQALNGWGQALKKGLTPLLLLSLGIFCLIVGETCATIDENGILHEVGPLLPLGAILFCIGLIGIIIVILLGIISVIMTWKK